MFAYQTKTDAGNDALNIMVDGYLPASAGVSPDVVITKENDKIVIKVSGSAVVQGSDVQVDLPDATTTTKGVVKQASVASDATVDVLIAALKTAGIVVNPA